MTIRVQRTTLKIQHCRRLQLNTQHSKLKNAKSVVRFYDEQGNETEMVVMKTGRDTSGITMNKWLINKIDIKCWH